MVDDEKQSEVVSKTISAAERLEKANEAMADNLRRQEELIARNRIGGQSEAGFQEKKKTPEEIKNEELIALYPDGGLNPFKGKGKDALTKKYD